MGETWRQRFSRLTPSEQNRLLLSAQRQAQRSLVRESIFAQGLREEAIIEAAVHKAFSELWKELFTYRPLDNQPDALLRWTSSRLNDRVFKRTMDELRAALRHMLYRVPRQHDTNVRVHIEYIRLIELMKDVIRDLESRNDVRIFTEYLLTDDQDDFRNSLTESVHKPWDLKKIAANLTLQTGEEWLPERVRYAYEKLQRAIKARVRSLARAGGRIPKAQS